jgi:LysM repeat protein
MRSPATVLLLISFFFAKFALCQSNELIVLGQTGNLFAEHTVVAKENWYSIGRLYNISPKELAPYNQLALTQPLSIGQTLKIPLTAVNFSQNEVKTPAETLVPLYYIVQEKEWMYRISVNHNKVPIPSLEKWNKTNGSQLHTGMHLIVGFLKVKTALSAFANGVPSAPVIAASTPAAADESDEKAAATTAPAKSPQPAPPVTKPAAAISQPAVSKPAATPPPVVSKPSQPAPSSQSAAASQSAPQPAATTVTTGTPAAVTPALHFNGGAFKGDYNETGKSASGAAGTFKSTSGWQDGKYYALMNAAPVGTIVKVSDPAGKSVYVKVLGQLPDMKESAGLTIRISNAAAADLGQGEGRFNVSVSY